MESRDPFISPPQRQVKKQVKNAAKELALQPNGAGKKLAGGTLKYHSKAGREIVNPSSLTGVPIAPSMPKILRSEGAPWREN
jgi:hypothetical protein